MSATIRGPAHGAKPIGGMGDLLALCAAADRRLSVRLAAALSGRPWNAVWRLLDTTYGTAPALYGAPLLLALVLARRGPRAASGGLVPIAAMLVADGLKAIVRRPRPLGRHAQPYDSSFPSGHAAHAAATAAYVLAQRRAGAASRRAALVGLLATNLWRIGRSRHWVSDVVAGTALGWWMGRLVGRWAREPLYVYTDREPTCRRL